MKKLNLANLLGWVLISAGIVFFGILIYQNFFMGKFRPETSRPRPDGAPPRSRTQPRPRRRPAETSAALGKVSNNFQSMDTQKVDGLSAVETFSHGDTYDSWDGRVESWWEYSNDPEQKVVWRSAVCPKKETTTLVFSGALGVATGESRLYVNDQPALNFNTGVGPETEEWKNGDYSLKFFAILIKPNQERHGIFCLTIPEKDVTAGKHVTLKAEGFKKTGTGNSFFMLSGITDTLTRLTPPSPPSP